MTTEQQNKLIVKRVIEAFTEKKLDVLVEMLHPNYLMRTSTEIPWGTVVQGKDNARKYFGQMFRDYPTFRSTIEDIIAEGDKVAVRYTWYDQGKPTDSAMGFFRLEDGKIVDDIFCYLPLKK